MQYFAVISYVGTRFSGFQIQPDVRTVQGTLTRAFSTLFGCPCRVSGCSRTDAGVHALRACVSVIPEGEAHAVPPEKIPQAIAPYLPGDLSVLSVRQVPDSFHIRHDVERKRYVYRLRFSPVRDPFSEGRAWQYPYPFPPGYEARMKRAAAFLLGEHDFASFMAAGSPVSSTVRRLDRADVDVSAEGITFVLEGNGFLYNMVRIIVGTLVDVGIGRRDPGEMPEILRSLRRENAGETAPPEGLYLADVIYPEIAFLDKN